MRDRSTHVDWLRIDDVAKHALANAQLPASGTFTRTIAAQIVDHGSGQARMRRREVASEHRSEEHTSELQSLMRISYAVFCLKKQKLAARHSYPTPAIPSPHK